jgi:hypothetical protein
MYDLSRLRRAPLRRAATSLCAIAAVAGVASVAAPAALAAPGDPDLRVSAPASSETDWFGYFDDHSVVGDGHNGWASGAGDPKWSPGTEPFAIRFQSSVQSVGAGLRVCGYRVTPDGAGSAEQWMSAFQVPSGQACPATAPASGRVGWLRYVIANHFHQNRWQLLDFERFALVRANGVPVTAPLPAAVTGPGDPNDPMEHATDDPSCDESLFFATVPDSNPAYAQLHCWTPVGTIPTNPALPATGTDPAFNGQGGVFWDDRWGSCITASTDGALAEACGKGQPNATTRRMDIAAGQTKGIEVSSLAEPTEQIIALDEQRDVPTLVANPGRYYIVSWVNPYGALGESTTANNIACTAVDVAAVDPAVNDGKSLRVTRSASQPATCPWQGSGAPASPVVAPATVVKGTTVVQTRSDMKTSGKALPRMRSTAAKTYARSAIRKALKFKATPTGLKSSCKVTSTTRSTCAVSWRSGRTSYKGTVGLSFALSGSQGRWRYSVDLTKKRGGHATAIRRSATTGGSVALVS